MKFLHSADWQIGIRFRQFHEAGAELRAARLRTLRRALQEADSRKADAFLIAGDLFEDNQLDSRAISAVYELLAEAARTPIFILPGNHDPFTGPASIWGRKPFSTPPPHVKVFRAPEAVAVGDGWLLGSPLTQKRSTADPTACLAALSGAAPAGTVKVGLAHGSPAIKSRHDVDDFPIALDAATRLGLDYLALGHWHNPLALDGGRMVMSGTPEPTDFSQTEAGCVYEVEISGPGQPPKVTPIRVAEREWRSVSVDLTDARRAREMAAEAFEKEQTPRERTVLRVTLEGCATPAAADEFRGWLREKLAGCGVVDIVDDTLRELDGAELAALLREHPLLEYLVKDLDALEAQAAGAPLTESGHSGFTASAFLELCEAIGCHPDEAAPEFFAAARRLLFRELREVLPAC